MTANHNRAIIDPKFETIMLDDKKREEIVRNPAQTQFLRAKYGITLDNLYNNYLSEHIFTQIINLGYIPLPQDLNIDQIDTGINRGLITCHGHSHRKPIIPDVVSQDVQWWMVDIKESAKPDYIGNILDPHFLEHLGYYQYTINYFCPDNDFRNIFNYIYYMRHIQVPGGAIILSTFKSLSKFELLDLNLTLEQIMAIYLDMMSLFAHFCGCSSITFHNVGKFSPKIKYNNKNQINSNNLYLIINI